MHELVRGYAAAALETASSDGDITRVQADLEELVRALERSDTLRNALSDPSIPTGARRAVLGDLLNGRAVAEAAELAGFASRIERASDLPLVITQLLEAARTARDAAVAGWGVIEVEGGGRRALRDRVHGYTERVLFELSVLEEIDTVEDELFEIARVFDSSAELRDALVDPDVASAPKVAVLDQLFGAKVGAATLRLVRFVVCAGRLRDLVGTIEWLVEIAAAERHRRVAEVRSAVELEPAEKDRLSRALGRIVDRNVEVRVVIDPAVIGGAFVSVGDLVIDGTVRQRFERLRDVLEQKS